MYAPLSHPPRRMHSRFALTLTLLAALALWMSAAKPAHAGYYPPAHSDAAYFHDSLSPYGTWTHHASYGAVWYPHGMAHGWRPYTHGRWVWDDGYGWTWASGFAWGWAPFHYGNWVWDAAFGWMWVPGRVWAPAWVTWRYSNTHIGWAPIGYGASYWSYSPGWNHGGWNYVHRHHFGAPVIHQHIIVVNQYQTIYRSTKHWAPPRNKHNRVVHRGFDRGFVEHGSRYKIDRVQARPEHWQRNDVRGGASGRNDWRDNRARHAAPERRVDGRHSGRPADRDREVHRPQDQRQLQDQQRHMQDRQRQQSYTQLAPQRRQQAQEPQRSRQAPPQRERQVEQQQRLQRSQQMQQHRQQSQVQQRQAHRTQSPPPRQTQERQRPPQQMQPHRQQQQVQQQREAQRAQPRVPEAQRQAPHRSEQRTERRDDGGGRGGDGRDGNRSWR